MNSPLGWHVSVTWDVRSVCFTTHGKDERSISINVSHRGCALCADALSAQSVKQCCFSHTYLNSMAKQCCGQNGCHEWFRLVLRYRRTIVDQCIVSGSTMGHKSVQWA